MSKTGVKKTLTFRKTDDFTVDFAYQPSSASFAPSGPLFSTQFQGISAATKNLTIEQLVNATVKVNVELDPSGLLKVGKATLILREEDEADGKAKEGVADKIKNLFNRFGGAKNATASGSAEKAGATGEPAAEGDAEKEPLSEEEKVALEELRRQAELPPAKTKLTVETAGASSVMGLDEKAEIKKR